MRILVFGADGFLGRNICRRLALEGMRPVKVGRRKSMIGRTGYVFCDVTKISQEALSGLLVDTDVVINVIGVINSRKSSMEYIHVAYVQKLVEACLENKVGKLIHVSALGADTNDLTDYQSTKGKSEEALLQLKGSHTDYCIVAPSIIIGPDGRSTQLFRALACLPLNFKIGGLLGHVQPILVDDFCSLVLKLLRQADEMPKRINAVGPDRMDINELVTTLREGFSSKSHVSISIPLGLLSTLSGVLSKFTRGIFNPDVVKMLSAENTADVGPVSECLGYKPHHIVRLTEFWPVTSTERVYARLYFLEPLLLYGLSFLWVLTGVLSIAIYPIDQSRQLVDSIGVHPLLGDVLIFGGGVLDIGLGIALAIRWKIPQIAICQIFLIVGYMFISIGLPVEYWIHPFAPLWKNIPIIIGTLVLIALVKGERDV